MNYETLSADELIPALEQAGRTPDLDLIRVCLERTDELEPALLDLLRIDPWQKYDLEDDTNPIAYGEIHAGHLLIAAQSQAALPIFDDIFRDPEREYLVEWFGLKLHHYGSIALPYFGNILMDEKVYPYGRSTSAAILTQITYYEPDCTPLVISIMQKLLPPLPEEGEPIIGDGEYDEMWMWAALELSNLGDRESLAQIEALYAVDAIDAWVIGDYDEHLARLQNEHSDVPDPYDIIQIYENLHHIAALEAEQDALLKELEQKRAEKKDLEQRAAERVTAKAVARDEQPSQMYEQVRGEPSTRKEPKVGRNAPCPCGSGKKYKKCCGRPGR